MAHVMHELYPSHLTYVAIRYQVNVYRKCNTAGYYTKETVGETVWDRVCMMVVDTLSTSCSVIKVHLCHSSGHLWNCQC